MKPLLIIFAVGFASVFLLGFQSRNVNHGHYGWAAATAFLIGLAQSSVWTRITAPGAGWAGAVAYGLASTGGIAASMWLHQRLVGRGSERP